jgi:hypothetical protein
MTMGLEDEGNPPTGQTEGAVETAAVEIDL